MRAFQSRDPRWVVIALTSSFVAFAGLVYMPSGACFAVDGGIKSLGLAFSYDAALVVQFFAERSPDQLACYRQFLLQWDVIFALLYGAMYASWIRALLGSANVMWFVPVMAAVLFDWIENAVEILLLDAFSANVELSHGLVALGSGLNMVKWLSLWIIYGTVLYGIYRKIRMKWNAS